MPNPYFFTDLVWYDQLNFDGFAATARTELADRDNLSFTLGAFPVETIDCTQAVSVSTCGSNKWLYGAQTVFETALRSSSSLKLGLAYYVWDNYEGRLNSPVVNPADRTYIPKFSQKGNTYFNVVTNGGNPLLGLAANFNELDLTAALDLGYWDPVRVVFTGNVVKNIGYNQEEIMQRTGGLVDLPPRTNAWYARVNVGMPTMQKGGD